MPLVYLASFFAPTLSEQCLILGAFIVICGILLGILQSIVTIWGKLRRNPSVDQMFATKAELANLEQRLMNSVAENRRQNEVDFSKLGEKVDASSATMNALSNDLMRAIGRVEGALKTPEAQG